MKSQRFKLSKNLTYLAIAQLHQIFMYIERLSIKLFLQTGPSHDIRGFVKFYVFQSVLCFYFIIAASQLLYTAYAKP
jgi:hypothetical protein